jgi:predicted acylesterase/phospholipase RssA
MPTSPTFKRVLYYSAGRTAPAEFLRALAEVSGCRSRTRDDITTVTCGGTAFSFVPRQDLHLALETLHHEFVNLVVLDLREPVRPRSKPAADFERGLALLDAMDREPDIERRYGFHRILALISGSDTTEVDQRIAVLGARGVGRVMRDLSTCNLHPGCGYLPSKREFARRVLEEMTQLCLHRNVGKRALCASGGGITGLYFELGALKCLEDCCSPGALNQCDLYFGISSGGVVAGMLANGYSVSDFMAAIAGVEGGPIPPLDLNLLDTAHLDLRGLMMPLRQLLTIAANGTYELLHGRLPFTLESLVFEYGDLVHAPFNTDGFEELLRRGFTRDGHTNDFRNLRCRLYIGATDQDRKEHVIFGEPLHDDVPISRAIQASMSLNPVFAPTEIGGRYYEDGAVTRTSNFGEAIAKGADLIFVLDPMVPYVSKDPGFARRRGVFYNADQDIRTISFTRYATTRNWVLRRHPHVSLYTFLPANQLRQLLSVNPMDHRSYLQIWRGAYLGTLRRVRALGYRMRGDLAFHGVSLDTSRAEAVAERLVATRAVTFADFFPDGRVEGPAPDPRRPRRRPRGASKLNTVTAA